MRLADWSVAERRALFSCLAVGVVATALALLSYEGRREARLAAIIVALDIFFVLAGSRAPRVGAMAALTVLAVGVGLAGLGFLLFLFVALVHDMPLGASLLISLPFAVMCVLQWLSFKAVADNDRIHE
jgi:hypothetical protein